MASKKKTGTELAKSDGGGTAVGFLEQDVAASMEAEARAQGGLGKSKDAADNLIPFIYVLQDNSPQTKEKNDKFVRGAKAGMFYRTDTKEVFESIIVMPCHMMKIVNEWWPRTSKEGSGIVRTHVEMPKDAKPHPEKDRLMRTADGKKDLIDTRVHTVLQLIDGKPSPAVISLKGSGHSVSRGWMVQQNNRLTPEGNDTPAWWTAFRLTTVPKSNDDGDWYSVGTEPLGWVNKQLRDAGKALYTSVNSGAQKPDFAAEADEHASGEDGASGSPV